MSVPPDEVLPCGCVIRCAVIDGTNTMTFIPCRTSCANYRHMLGLASSDGVPVEYRNAP